MKLRIEFLFFGPMFFYCEKCFGSPRVLFGPLKFLFIVRSAASPTRTNYAICGGFNVEDIIIAFKI